MTKFWAICRNTFLQTIRQPIFCILIVLTFVVLTLDLPLSNWAIGSADYHESNQRLLEQLGLSTLLVSGLLLAAFTSSSVLSREIEDKTALTVVAKPVSRATFILGKFGGVAGAVVLAYYLCSLVLVMTVRHKVRPAVTDPHDWPVIVLGLTAFVLAIGAALVGNIVFGWTFTSAVVWCALALLSMAVGVVMFVGKGWKIVEFGHDIRPQLLVAMVLTLMAVLVFCAVAIAASTRLGQAMTLLVCFGVFLVGQMYPFLFKQWGSEVLAVRLFGWIAPNLTYFDALEALTKGRVIPLSLVGLYALYCVLYVSGVLALGISLFHGRELEARVASSSLPGLVGLLAGAGRLAAVVAAGAALVVLSLPRFHTLRGLLLAAGLLAVGVVVWVLWGAFGRGRKWAWWVVLATAAIALVERVLVTAGLWAPRGPGRVNLPLRVIGFTLTAAVIAILLLPKTRHHFAFGRGRKGRRAGGSHVAGTGSSFAR